MMPIQYSTVSRGSGSRTWPMEGTGGAATAGLRGRFFGGEGFLELLFGPCPGSFRSPCTRKGKSDRDRGQKKWRSLVQKETAHTVSHTTV